MATYIAHGDVALSVLMTTASTLGAIFMTPLLTKLLAGTLVPVDAVVSPICTHAIEGNLNLNLYHKPHKAAGRHAGAYRRHGEPGSLAHTDVKP